jgi:hypothetical protein
LCSACILLGGRVVPSDRRIAAATAFLAVSVLGAVAIPAVTGFRMTERFDTANADLHGRQAHWSEALQLMGDEWTDPIFGKGLGSFPRLYLAGAKGPETKAHYHFGSDGDGTWLEIGPGDFNITQKVPLQPHTGYELGLSLRSASAEAPLSVKFCPKLILFSDRWQPNCREVAVRSGAAAAWTRHVVRFDSGTVGREGWVGLPVTMMLHNGGETAVRISYIRLLDSDGRNLVANGDFAAGSDRWILISDFEHLSWHVKNLYLQVFFEGGTAWLAVFLLVLGVAIGGAIRSARARPPLGPGMVGALCGFAVVGLTGSLLDNPRPAILFYLVLVWALRTPANRIPASAG